MTATGVDEILVVEDEPDLRATLREVLEDEGYSVLEAANGLEAQVVLRQGNPCAILLDLMMPIMNGWDFLAWLCQQPQHSLPVIVVSAASRERIDGAQAAACVVEVLEKPVRLDELLTAIEKHC